MLKFSRFFQLGVFAWYAWGSGGVAAAAGPVPVDSPLVYRPDRRHELWRFLTYSVVHAGWLHLAFNLLVQLAVSQIVLTNVYVFGTLYKQMNKLRDMLS